MITLRIYEIMSFTNEKEKSQVGLAMCKKNKRFPFTDYYEWKNINPMEIDNLKGRRNYA